MGEILTISQWSGMSDNGVFYAEGFGPIKVNGKSFMSVKYYNNFVLSEDTPGFTGLGYIFSGQKYKYDGSTLKTLFIDTNGKMFIHSAIGLIHTCSESINWCDLAITKNNNILFTTQNYLGIGYIGQAKTGSSATKIVDKAGRNLSVALGMSTTSGINKLYNLTKKEEHTITSISTTDATNDTANFASGSGDSADDWYLAFNELKFNFFATTPYPHFVNQPVIGAWKRQIVPFSSGSTGGYLIGNGNYLAFLNIDESTFNDNYKQLPDNTQFSCCAVNNAGYVLVGSEFNGRGRINLWDGFTTAGFQGQIDIPNVPTCIITYGSGWIVIAKHVLYYTDGFSIKEYYTWPDCEDDSTSLNTFYNSAISYNKKIIVSVCPRSFSRNKTGLGILEPDGGMVFVPFSDGVGQFLADGNVVHSGAVFFYSESDLDYIYSGLRKDSGTVLSVLNQLRTGRVDIFPIAKNGASFIVYIPFGRKIDVKKIALSVTPKINSYNQASNPDNYIAIKLAVGDGKRPFWSQTEVGAGSTASAIINSAATIYYRRGYVGQQIRMLNGNCNGDKSYITAVANPGTATETWTISPALSQAPATNDDINIINLFFQETKTMQIHNLPEQIEFDVRGIYSENIFVEIELTGANVGALDISNFKIYD